MNVDWPLTCFTAIGLLVATLTCRLLVHTARTSFRAIRAAGARRRQEPRASLTNATFDLGERSSP
jgi:hypothetical protein